jgi:ParB family chromosome partitioning protein
MKLQRIERIPIKQIRVVNPRSRNKKTFRAIINNIDNVGLKKPITVFRRELAEDGTRYDLVCGQGRLESVAALGGKDIPAIITDASLKERYLMSLIENIARKRPPLSDLLLEVRRLKKSGHRNVVIAEKLGLGHTYVEGIIHLLKCGEDRLVERVEAGNIPLSVAVKIATADDAEIQRALGDAYDKGELRGAKLYAVQRLVAQRSARQRGDPATAEPKVSTKDLVKEYERHTHRQRELVARAVVVRERLALLTAALRQLLADKNFVQLLATEGLETMPEQLAVRLR